MGEKKGRRKREREKRNREKKKKKQLFQSAQSLQMTLTQNSKENNSELLKKEKAVEKMRSIKPRRGGGGC